MAQSERGKSAKIDRKEMRGVDCVSIERAGLTEYFLTAPPGAEERPFDIFEDLCKCVRKEKARIIGQDVFGSCALHEEGMRALRGAGRGVVWPVTWIEGDAGAGASLRGSQMYAVYGPHIQRIRMDDRNVGAVYEGPDARYCLLGDIRPSDPSFSKIAQTREVFEKMSTALELIGMDFSNVVRTWMYIDDILSWYDDFNSARTDYFKKNGVFDGIVPASTGVGVRNAAGTALVADAIAMKGLNESFKVETLPSPLQGPAPSYGSSFSRALEAKFFDHRKLYVSGTASIDADGKSVHERDVSKQIELTMQVVAAILESRKAEWDHVSRAVAYFKNMKDAAAFDAYCKKAGIPRLPVAVAHSDICRDELLFEIEVDAVIPN